MIKVTLFERLQSVNDGFYCWLKENHTSFTGLSQVSDEHVLQVSGNEGFSDSDVGFTCVFRQTCEDDGNPHVSKHTNLITFTWNLFILYPVVLHRHENMTKPRSSCGINEVHVVWDHFYRCLM